MRFKKKVLVFAILLMALCTLVGCKRKIKEYAYGSFFPFGEVIADKEHTNIDDIIAEKKLNPEEIYKNIDYKEYMFYGDYMPSDFYSSGEYEFYSKNFADNIEYKNASWLKEDESYYSGGISALPYRIEFGPSENEEKIALDHRYEWAELSFNTITAYSSDDKKGSLYVQAAYSVEGNQIIFKLIDRHSIKQDYENKTYEYKFSGVELAYEFSFRGPSLTISDGKNSYQLLERYFVSEPYFSYDNIYIDGDARDGYKSIDNIANIYMSYSNRKDSSNYFRVETWDGVSEYNNSSRGAIQLYENGIADFTFTDSDGVVRTYEFLYLYLGSSGSILFFDENNTYFYLNDWLFEKMTGESEYTYNNNIAEEDQAAYEALDEEKKEKLEKTRTQLLNELKAEFSANGIEAQVDLNSGEISLDSAILFKVDDSSLSAEGNSVVDDFMKTFAGILEKEDYKDFVKKIIVEGHTDSDGTQEHNEELSLKRAKSVLDQCLVAVEVDETAHGKFSSLLEPVGKASSELIYDSEGKEDKKASRRVVFMFYMNIN